MTRALAALLAAGLAAAPAAAQDAPPDPAPAAAEPAPAAPTPAEREAARRIECQRAISDTTAAVTGVARDSATGVALPDAGITLTWDRGPDQPLGQATTKTGDGGTYFLCPVRTGVPVTTSATFPHRRAEGVVTIPPGGPIVRLDFVLTGEDAPDEDRPSRITLLETGPAGETVTVTGTVRDEATGAPLVGAQVSVPELKVGTVTEPGGRFRLGGLPAGEEHVLVVEHLGYRTAEEPLPAAASDYTAVAWLSPRAIAMDALEVRARSREAEEARASGSARYRVGRSDFEARPTASIMDVLRANVPGVRTARDARGCPVVETRRGRALIVLDGVPFRDGCILNEIHPEAVESVEVHSAVAASTRWGSLGGNGVVEITTRRE